MCIGCINRYKAIYGKCAYSIFVWERLVVGETCVGVFVRGDSTGIHLRKVYDTCTRVYAYVIYFT